MQSYTEIPSSATLQESLALLLANDKTALSNSAGSSFPTANLQLGMFCLRTDQSNLYQLRDLSPTWVKILDLSAHLTAVSVNIAASAAPSVWPYGMAMGTVHTNGYPCGYGTVISLKGSTANSITQLLIGWASADGAVSPYVGVRNNRDTANQFSNWSQVWTSDTDGSGSGLDADRLDGYDLGNESGRVPINNGSLNNNLNADMLDGYHAGLNNGTGPTYGFIPIVNTSGVMEVGRYVDFHQVSGDGIDYSHRLEATGDGLALNGFKLMTRQWCDDPNVKMDRAGGSFTGRVYCNGAMNAETIYNSSAIIVTGESTDAWSIDDGGRYASIAFLDQYNDNWGRVGFGDNVIIFGNFSERWAYFTPTGSLWTKKFGFIESAFSPMANTAAAYASTTTSGQCGSYPNNIDFALDTSSGQLKLRKIITNCHG